MAKGPRDVVDAQADADGNIESVLIEGNSRFTKVEKAMEMADKRDLRNVHSVRPREAKPHLRSNPDKKSKNNLDDMAGDTPTKGPRRK